jgi:hypothetical protein
MKTIFRIVMAVGMAGLLSQSAFADLGEHTGTPDSGSTLALFSVAMGGVAALKRFLR